MTGDQRRKKKILEGVLAVETLHKGCKSGAQRRREKKSPASAMASVSGEDALPVSGEKEFE
jgi:hypothetical protein